MTENKLPEGTEARLYVLRRWNSFTPVLPVSDSGPGGGYFLYWNNGENPRTGLVIDPGFDFLRNYQTLQLPFHAIHGIVLTHSHVDHVRDFETILTGKFERDDTIDRRQEKSSGDAQGSLDLYISVDSFRKFAAVIDDQGQSTVRKQDILPLSAGTLIDLREKYGMEIEVIRAHHGSEKRPWLLHAVSLIFHLYARKRLVCSIGFTGDTQPLTDPDIISRFAECDLVVGHLGTVSLPQLLAMAKLGVTSDMGDIRNTWDDLKEDAYKPGERHVLRSILGLERDSETLESEQLIQALEGKDELRKTPKSGHLQFLGLLELFAATAKSDGRSRLGIVSEFGLELGSFRHKVADAINVGLFGNEDGTSDGRIITGDIGLVVRIGPPVAPCGQRQHAACAQWSYRSTDATLSIRCTRCGRFVPPSCIADLCIRYRDQAIVYNCHACLEHEFSPPQSLIGYAIGAPLEN